MSIAASRVYSAKNRCGAITGFMTGKQMAPGSTTCGGQIASQVGAALRNTGSIQKAACVGGAAIAAKAAVVTAAATAAAPVVATGAVIAAVVYGVRKLLR